MTDYLYDLDICFDPDNPNNIVRGALIEIYDGNDLEGTTLLQLKDTSGNPIPNPMTSNEYGVIGRRIATSPQCIWKSGAFSGVFNSYKGLRDEAIAARGAAEAAASDANQSALAAAESAQLALGPTDEQVDAGILRVDLSQYVAPSIEQLVPAAVAESLANDGTPAAAAAAAVNTKLSQAGIVTGSKDVRDSTPIAFGITDKDGNRSWLEISLTGTPTPEAAAMIATAITTQINTLITAKTSVLAVPQELRTATSQVNGVALAITDQNGQRSWLEVSLSGTPTPEAAALILTSISSQINGMIDAKQAALPAAYKAIPDSSGVAFALTDKDGQRSWLEVALDGGPTQNAVDLISAKLSIQSVPSTVKSAYNSADVIKVVSGPDIVLGGDSMTAADWATKLAQLTGRTVTRGGVGGETSAGIAARFNAMPYLMLPDGGAIPASGPVNVTLTSSGGGQTWPLLQGSGTPDGKAMGVLAGIPGEMTLVKGATALPYHGNDDVYVFTRTTPGAAVTVNRPSPFYYDYGELRRGDIMVLWAGRNNFAEDNGDRAFRDIKAITNYLRALQVRFLVLSVHNGANEGIGTTNYPLITGLNKRLLAEYGRRFVDHRTYSVQYGLADLGITPTAQDTADMAADTVPASLRIDTIHQTVAAREGITAVQVNLRLRELGWV